MKTIPGILFAVMLMIGASMTEALAQNALATFKKVADANAHEGPTCVADLDRLYFTSKPKRSAHPPYTAIEYLDLRTGVVHPWVERSNMVNGMWLSKDKQHLLLAEQGTKQTPGGIASIDLNTKKHRVLVNQFKDKPLNSPNKVLQSRGEMVYFSDPNYGYLQGFKAKPQLHNGVYAYAMHTEQAVLLTSDLVMPHGLGLSHDEKYLYIADTAALDSKGPIDFDAPHDIYRAALITPIKLGPLVHLISVEHAVPDGFLVLPNGDLVVATTAGVYYYDQSGVLKEKQALPSAPINLTYCKGAIFVTADSAIYRAKINHH